MNRPPLTPSTTGSLSSFRRRKKRPRINMVFIMAGLLVVGGLVILIMWLSGPDQPLSALFATETPTPTETATPTNTATVTPVPTETETPTITPTPTFSTPFNYTVQEGDSLAVIVDKYNLGEDGIALILLLNPFDPATGIGINPATQIIIPGQVILLPNPDMKLPTATPIPPDLRSGTLINYTVQAGDSLAAIAARFNSTIEAIVKQNNITNPNALFTGQQLQIPVNLVTPTATRPPTSTPITPGPGTIVPTASPTPIN